MITPRRGEMVARVLIGRLCFYLLGFCSDFYIVCTHALYVLYVLHVQSKALVVLNGPLCDNLYKPTNKKAPRVEYPTEVGFL